MSMNFGIAEYWYDLYDFLLENTLHDDDDEKLHFLETYVIQNFAHGLQIFAHND